MSRNTPETARPSASDEAGRVLTARRGARIANAAMAKQAGWDYWLVRLFLISCTGAVSYTLRPFELRGLAAAGVGLLIGLTVLLAELRLRRAALSGLLGGTVGTVIGVFVALLVTLVISRTNEPEPTKSFLEYAVLFAFGYLGLVLGS